MMMYRKNEFNGKAYPIGNENEAPREINEASIILPADLRIGRWHIAADRPANRHCLIYYYICNRPGGGGNSWKCWNYEVRKWPPVGHCWHLLPAALLSDSRQWLMAVCHAWVETGRSIGKPKWLWLYVSGLLNCLPWTQPVRMILSRKSNNDQMWVADGFRRGSLIT